MALIREVAGMEERPDGTHAGKLAKYPVRRDRALSTIVLAVDPSLLYLLGDPEDPKLCEQGCLDSSRKRHGQINSA